MYTDSTKQIAAMFALALLSVYYPQFIGDIISIA